MFNATFTSPATTPSAESGIGLGSGTSVSSVAGSSGLTDVERMRAELDRLLAQQRELMQLLGTIRPDRLVHDLRNLLQERMFLEAACKRFGG